MVWWDGGVATCVSGVVTFLYRGTVVEWLLLKWLCDCQRPGTADKTELTLTANTLPIYSNRERRIKNSNYGAQ